LVKLNKSRQEGKPKKEVLKALTILAMHDEQFRSGVFDDLEGTLTRYGFALSDQEMAQVRTFRDAFVGSLDQEIFELIRTARR
jgi:hypothetical protein